LNFISPTRSEMPVMAPAPQAAASPFATSVCVEAVDCLHAFSGAWNWSAGVAALLSLVQSRMAAYRVSLAWHRGHGLSLVAWTDVAPLDEGVGVNELESACNEALSWAHGAVWPACSTGQVDESAMQAHIRLFHAQGLTAVMSVPIRNQRGQVVGVMACERIPLQGDSVNPAGSPGFVAAELAWLASLVQLMGPVMAMRHALEQPWYARSWSWMEALGQRLGDPRERLLRGAVLSLFGIGAFMAGWPLPYSVSMPARLEAQVQTAVIAPTDATVLTSDMKVGDLVQAGQRMSTLSPAPALRSREDLGEQLLKVDKLIQDAHQANDDQALERWQDVRTDVQQRLDGLRDVGLVQTVTAPFDGVVIRQVERTLSGAHVQRGDALWVVAPGLDWRVVLEADEAVVARLQTGQRGSLRLGRDPDRVVQLVLRRPPVPAATNAPEGVRFDVEALAVGGTMTGLRPGWRGTAHIDMPPRPVLWRAVDRIRAWWLLTIWELW
jgi:hypothetical protein